MRLELAERLGLSRTPVRAALLRLAQSGLVVAQRGRATVVGTLDARDIRDARDVVVAMHEVAGREAIPALVETDLASGPRRHGAMTSSAMESPSMAKR